MNVVGVVVIAIDVEIDHNVAVARRRGCWLRGCLTCTGCGDGRCRRRRRSEWCGDGKEF